jgi:hypothetical protein
MTFKALPIFFVFAAASVVANAQFQGQTYFMDEGVKVFAGAQEKTMAWCGGFDNPQIALADLNHDGKKDLVVYERDYKQLKTFINYGAPGNPDYRYKPQYAKNFPVVDEYLKMEDYNRDTIPDLFHKGLAGVDVYKGYYNGNNELCFNHYKSLFYDNDTHSIGEVNVYVEPSDIPALLDMDGDGDLDMLAYWSGGAKMYYYKNYQVEDGWPKDSIMIKLADRCWGKLDQVFKRTHNLGVTCDNSGLTGLKQSGQNRHTGNCLCMFDADGDGDYDYMDGNISFSDIQFIKNGKVENSYPVDTMVSQDTTWQSNGHVLNMPQWPATFWLDIDQDGDKDLLFTPHWEGTENYKCIALYRNTGSDASPVFTFQSDTFLMDKIIDAGSGSYPMFYDYDKDGKPDLIVGSDGYYQANGTFRSHLLYFKNTSSGFQAALTLQTTDFDSLFAENMQGAAPAAGDLDNDGKDDLVLGKSDGTIAFFPNTAASQGVQPNWKHTANTQMQLKDSSNTVITVAANAAPFIYDLNKDGKPDLIIGSRYGYLAYYQNISTTAGQVKLALRNVQVGHVNPDSMNFINYSVPFIGKMDNTGNDYILCGSNSGAIYRYDGFQTGNTAINYPTIDTMYSFIHDGVRSAPAVGDIDGDGKYEMVIGNLKGGLTIYSQNQAATINNTALVAGNTKDVRAYPNPAKDMLYFSWNKEFAQAPVHVAIYAATGQLLTEHTVSNSPQGTVLNITNIPSGTYFCEVVSGLNKSVLTVTILK